METSLESKIPLVESPGECGLSLFKVVVRRTPRFNVLYGRGLRLTPVSSSYRSNLHQPMNNLQHRHPNPRCLLLAALPRDLRRVACLSVDPAMILQWRSKEYLHLGRNRKLSQSLLLSQSPTRRRCAQLHRRQGAAHLMIPMNMLRASTPLTASEKMRRPHVRPDHELSFLLLCHS